MLAGFDSSLGRGTLEPGQHTCGFVTFDVLKGRSGGSHCPAPPALPLRLEFGLARLRPCGVRYPEATRF